MATVKMKKGDKYADVFDSPETIKQAQLDGYSIVEQPTDQKKEIPVVTKVNKVEDTTEGTKVKTGNSKK